MNFISICSGIEAASVAFSPLGWKAIAFSEIEPFPCAVLAHHYPDVPNFGDMTKFREWPEEIFANADAVVGGPPCQAFSVAGARNGLNDDRGNLTLTYAELINHADAIRFIHGKPPVVVLYENVHGLLSDKTGAFGCFLAGLAGEDCALEPPGGRWTDAGCVLGPERAIAWRTLDAQFFGLAQRRRRVFVVASARAGFDPAAVLFEFDGVRRDSAPRREAGEAVAGTFKACASSGGWSNSADHAAAGYMQPVAQPVITMAHGQGGAEIGFDASEDGTGRGTPLVPVAFDTTQITSAANYSNPKPGDPCHPLAAGAHAPAIAFLANLSGTQHASTENLAPSMAVRRLIVEECEFLQGFPRGYTAIPWRGKPADQCPDGPRYKALGNSWAVPVVAWIGKRIQGAIN